MKESKLSVAAIAAKAILMTAIILAANGCANSTQDGGNGGSNQAQGEGTAKPDGSGQNGVDGSTNAGEGDGNEPTTSEQPGGESTEPEPEVDQPDGGSAPTGEGKPDTDDGTSGKAYVAENEAFRILSPEIDAQVGRTFTVKGQARVFEAAFSYTFEDGHEVLAEGHVQASQGAPEWGDFEFEVQVKEPISPTSPTGTLTIYEVSAKDGSPVHQLTITVQFDPALLPAEE
ncbi:Gmad2 immunoglobulin-like domain-containing protein [Paenibacillus xanthanilyticus]|uniref:Gmad2 immunoglobulin-like domain-containing protein n=1 Tax=Paenibacillus xanthanilyticus TaxID=1783531 RepID=A0ABV8K1E4_9BACL